MPLVGTKANAGAFGLGWSAAEVLGGMVLLTPTSIAYSGTSATIGPSGSVTFDSCTTLRIEGVFTSAFQNYAIAVRSTALTAATNVVFRLRAGGVEDAGANYTFQSLLANGSTISGNRTSGATLWGVSNTSLPQRSGDFIYVYGPNLLQQTVYRNISANGQGDAYIVDDAGTHSLSNAYDGFTLFTNLSAFSGLVSVYGLVGA